MKFKLNGVDKEYEGEPEGSLLRWLRDEEGIISAKDGCSPQASCGCCTIELGGKSVLSCVTSMKQVAGKEIVTTEGMGKPAQDAFASAFAHNGGAQCGFCIPGIVMRAWNLVKKTPEPTQDDIERGLNQHLCRCTGYKKIVASIQDAAKILRTGKPSLPPAGAGGVGTRLPKYDIKDAVLGRRPYVADMKVPGMLHAALRLSDHPRAKVLKIDTAAALAMPGVTKIFLAGDIPGRRLQGSIIQDWPVMVAAGEITGYVGDVLAMIVAGTRPQAQAAAKAVKVEYNILTPIIDIPSALAPDAPKLQPKGNVLSVSKAKKGDAAKALAACDFVHEATYQTQWIEHAYMEPEAALALPEDGRLIVYTQSQGIYEDRKQLAAMLTLPEDKIDVVLVPNGGGFGGKEDMLAQSQAALAAHLLGKPVKIEISREESILMHSKRHPLRMEYKLGCGKDGKLKALFARIYGDTGIYASVGMKVLERAAGHSTGGYFVPDVDVEATAVITNNVPCGAMRGFGANQATFAMECAVDELCEKGGFDRWQFRWDNALVDGLTTSTGQVLTGGVGVRATLAAVKDRFKAAKFAGIGCGIKNTGIGNGMPDFSEVEILVRAADRVEIHHGWTEMGQGVDTIAVQVVCSETGLTPDLLMVRTRTSDNAPAGMTTASRATSLVGNALIDACKALKSDLKREGLAALVGRRYRGKWVCDWTTKPGYDTHGKPVVTHYSYSYATQVAIVGDDGKVAELIAAHDAGKIMNPTMFEGQIEGSLHMGLGYAISEELVMENGRPKSTKLRDCGVLRAKETPKLTVIGVEVPDPIGPYGAKGVGEIGLVPTAGAVANAFWAFDGKRRRTLPMKS
ncbi:MAG: selenium-dependent xanthine dehydrogenase [Elusimicrobia bacterium CG11_big_fil_rev_8_21_14_0_20_64_6]|nr:MAG: selenium-dependent xanthine dehydrogenase [Elusimicrobia bacterium CG11_big_fil_rev_8_21_14_0_20_64_6]